MVAATVATTVNQQGYYLLLAQTIWDNTNNPIPPTNLLDSLSKGFKVLSC